MHDGRLWTNGGENYYLNNSEYNFWTPNGGTSNNASNPPTTALPVKDTDSLTAKTQIFPAAGFRHATTGPGIIVEQGSIGSYCPTTPERSYYAYALNFREAYANPAYMGVFSAYASGNSIRCVRI
jgi:hypothetical protein